MSSIRFKIYFIVLTTLLVGGFPNFMAQEAFAVRAYASSITGAVGGDSVATTNLVVTFDGTIYAVENGDGATFNKNTLFTVTGNTVTTANVIGSATGECVADGATATVTLVLGTAIATDARPTVTFANNGTVDSCDDDGDATNFTTQQPDDGLSPQFSSASASGTTVDVVFTETIDDAGTVAIGDFTLTGNTLTGVPSVSGATVTLTVTTEIATGDTLTIAYAETSGDLEDANNNFVRTFTAQSVTNGAAADSGIH